MTKKPFYNEFMQYYKDNIKGLSEDAKMKMWGKWSGKNNEFPDKIDEFIKSINISKNFDFDATYGFQIMFYAFMEGKDIQEIMEYFEVDYFGYQIIYTPVIAV